MALGLFFFGANIVALTANLLTGGGLLISNPRSVNARLFAAVTLSAAPFDNVVTLVMAMGYVALVLTAFRFDTRALERLLERASPSPDPKTDPSFDRDFAKLARALNDEKVYLAHGLSIGALATRLALPEYRLRALINKRLGYRNFNALLHEHRLRDACERLADPAQAHLPILTIALDVGYQSIAPFNQAFRDALGCTPSEYRRKYLANGANCFRVEGSKFSRPRVDTACADRPGMNSVSRKLV
jgi:AraC-like DNA-binding protein